MTTKMTTKRLVSLMVALATAITATVSYGESWAAGEMQKVLTTPSLEMTLQGGLPVRVVNRLSKTELLTVPLDGPLSVELLVGQPIRLDEVDVGFIGDVTVDGETQPVTVGDVVFVPWKTPHMTEAGAAGPLVYLCLNSIVTEEREATFQAMYDRVAADRIARWKSGDMRVGD